MEAFLKVPAEDFLATIIRFPADFAYFRLLYLAPRGIISLSTWKIINDTMLIELIKRAEKEKI
jgi:hypothetical protein